ncbi:MAG: CapA family protein [Rhodovibrionaceae bacterium]
MRAVLASLGVTLLLAAPAQGAEELRVLFLGDTAFGENYQEGYAAEGGENLLETEGYDHPLVNFRKILERHAHIVANFETTLSARRESPYEGRKTYLHHSDPERAGPAYAAMGLDIVSLANNHAYDYGTPGLEDSMAALEALGIETCGGGMEYGAAARPAYIEGGLRPVAIFCVFQHLESYEKALGSYAGVGIPGVAPFLPAALARQIAAIRRLAPETLVVVYPHWLRNYRPVEPEQRRLARAAIEAGADIVIGHGSHMLQEVEYYRGRWIVYSLGNFVFLTEGRYRQFGALPYSLIARLTLVAGPKVGSLRLYPIHSDNAANGYRGRFATRAERDALLPALYGGKRMQALPGAALGSDGYGPYLDLPLGLPQQEEAQAAQ